MELLFEIGYKEGVFDAIGEGMKKDLADIGVEGASEVKSLQLYLVKGKPSRDQIRFIADEILTDPITQYSSLVKTSKKQKDTHFIEVWFKRGVTDAVGDSVKKAIEDIGIKNIDSIATGKKFVFIGKITDKQLEEIASKLLSNPQVEDSYINENPHN